MSEALVDLSALAALDLQALRLGAEVMSYKARLAERPRVKAFFAALRVGVDGELVRRDRAHALRARSVAFAFGEPGDGPDQEHEDRRLLGEYLGLLSTNPRLSIAVREAWDTIGDQLAGPETDGSPDTMV